MHECMHIGDPKQRKHVVRTKCNAGILLHISKSIRSFFCQFGSGTHFSDAFKRRSMQIFYSWMDSYKILLDLSRRQ